LAEILKEYIDNPLLIKEQSHNARELVELKYNWDDRDKDFITLLKG
jgi:glycosyltransferase involved in cell wall biosynthesis